jgi:diguanylate cyclase (GGDEF)-like protein
VPIASSDDKPDDESARGARPSPRRRLAAAFVNAVARGDLTWRLAALLLAANGGLIAVVSIAGLVEPLTLAEGAAVAGGNVALALGCLWAGTAGLPEKWLHAPWVVAYALIATAIALSRGSGVALLDLLPLMAMYGFVMFGPRTAAIYMVGAQAAYGVFAISGGYFQGALRTGITTVVAAEVGLLIGKLRQLTVQFARANRELSEVDELTGVANWRALKSRVTEVMSRASSQQLHPWLVAIDLDGFKQVNDMHCHSTGDRVLIAVARAISDSVRVDELVARRGGDEFVVVVEDGHAAHTEAIVRRITDAIARARARVCPDVTPTACVACVACKSGGPPDALLREADLALHREKAAAHRLAAAQRPLVSGGPAASTLRGDQ